MLQIPQLPQFPLTVKLSKSFSGGDEEVEEEGDVEGGDFDWIEAADVDDEEESKKEAEEDEEDSGNERRLAE